MRFAPNWIAVHAKIANAGITILPLASGRLAKRRPAINHRCLSLNTTGCRHFEHIPASRTFWHNNIATQINSVCFYTKYVWDTLIQHLLIFIMKINNFWGVLLHATLLDLANQCMCQIRCWCAITSVRPFGAELGLRNLYEASKFALLLWTSWLPKGPFAFLRGKNRHMLSSAVHSTGACLNCGLLGFKEKLLVGTATFLSAICDRTHVPASNYAIYRSEHPEKYVYVLSNKYLWDQSISHPFYLLSREKNAVAVLTNWNQTEAKLFAVDVQQLCIYIHTDSHSCWRTLFFGFSFSAAGWMYSMYLNIYKLCIYSYMPYNINVCKRFANFRHVASRNDIIFFVRRLQAKHLDRAHAVVPSIFTTLFCISL